MPTNLYLKTHSFPAVSPTDTNSSDLAPEIGGVEGYRPATLPSFMLMDETRDANINTNIGGSVLLFNDSNFVFLGVWTSPTLQQTVTISDNFYLCANMCEQYDVITREKPVNHTYSMNLYPYMNMYTFDPVLGKRNTVFIGYISPEAGFVNTLTTRTIAPPDNVLFSAGDKLVVELWAYHNAPHWFGYGKETTSILPDTRIYFPTLDMNFGTFSEKTLNERYFIWNKVLPETLLTKYRLNPLIATLSSRYYIFGTDVLNWYYETESPGRGRASLMIRSRCENGFDDNFYITDYNSKWKINGPSIHHCLIVDDFEYYTDSDGFGGVWSISDETHSFKATRPWATDQSASNCNLLTFYAKSNNPTLLSARLWDSSLRTTTDISFLITDKWERYEATISWGQVDSSVLRGIQFESSNSGNIILDDIFLLKYATESENYDWSRLMMLGMDASREMRYSTFRIPFTQGELIQFHGENNGEGNLSLFAPNMEQTEFLSELMRFQKPVYLRYKNRGVPIIMRDLSKKIRNIASSSIQHEITIQFYELYDYLLY